MPDGASFDSRLVFLFTTPPLGSRPGKGRKEERKMKKENLSLILDLLADSHRALEKKLQEETILKEYWLGECENARMEKAQLEGKEAKDEAV